MKGLVEKNALRKYISVFTCILMLLSIFSTTVSVNAAATNIAVGKTASADSGNSSASNGNDDSPYTQWRVDDPNGNHWWKVDLGQTYDLTGTEVMWEAAQLYHYKVDVSSDGINWTTRVDKSGNTDTNQTQTDNFTASGIRYVRIVCLDAAWIGMYELSVFGTPGSGGGTVATPTINPAPGTYTTAQTVNILCDTSGATIKYTTDGSNPTANSPAYTGAIIISSTATVKAYAVKSGMTDSAIASANYIINSSSGTNIAQGKTATASTQWSPSNAANEVLP